MNFLKVVGLRFTVFSILFTFMFFSCSNSVSIEKLVFNKCEVLLDGKLYSGEYQKNILKNNLIIGIVKNGFLTETREYISDGETLEIFYTWDGEVPEGFQIYDLNLFWTYEETNEETNPNGPVEQTSCFIDPGQNALDSTQGVLNHNDFLASDEVVGGGSWGLGEPGYRDQMTLLVNSTFMKDSNGQIVVNTNAPIFTEAATRREKVKEEGLHEGPDLFHML